MITFFVIKSILSIVVFFVFEFIVIIIIVIIIVISFVIIIIKIIIKIVLTIFIKELIVFRFDMIMLFIMSVIFDKLLNDFIIKIKHNVLLRFNNNDIF